MPAVRLRARATRGPDYEVWLEDDRIAAVRPASGRYDFAAKHETYIVLEE